MKVKLEYVRSLECLNSTDAGRPSFVAAGSGLVFHDQHFYVVADDECHLAYFSHNPDEKGQFINLLSRSLPLEHKLRKKEKPDLECLLKLDHETLLALPSGSKENRIWGVKFNLQNHSVIELNLEKSYKFLSQKVQELNIEGAILKDESLYLFQRGNGATFNNSIIILKLVEFLEGSIQEIKVIPVSLGKIKNIPYSFTDASLGPNDDIYFLAAAENSESTYDDGEFLGAIIGCINTNGEVIFSRELDISGKPEGLSFDEQGNFFIVTDEDDIKKASLLYRGNF